MTPSGRQQMLRMNGSLTYMQDGIEEIVLVLVEERQLPTHHLKQHHTQSPPINFPTVVVVKEHLNVRIQEYTRECNNKISSIQEYTRILRISM